MKTFLSKLLYYVKKQERKMLGMLFPGCYKIGQTDNMADIESE